MPFEKGHIPWIKGRKLGIANGYKIPSTAFKKGHISWHAGKKGIQLNTGRTHFKKGERLEANHPGYKGDKVGYSGLHKWVASRLGRPKECSLCGDTTKKIYDWANISHEYKRELSDWIRLCRKCHWSYDGPKERLNKIRWQKT